MEDLVKIIFGLVAHDQGNHEAAIASLKPADTSNVDTANIILTQMVLADSYLSLGQPEKAQKCYNRVLKVHPEYKLALNNQAFIQLENKNPKEAEKLFTKIIQLDSTNTQALAGRAAARIEMKQEIKAEEDVKRIREIDPKARFPVLEKVKVLRDER
ncbi:MAG: tetratricopeptide repeat protein [Saprospirales bacterium]|nr:tetratricopeptide repeat protein [Saprospirales bacterium]